MMERHTKSLNIIGARVIRENNLTLVTLPNGDILMADNFGYGLYYHDCRFLSGYTLKINGKSPTEILSSGQRDFESSIVLTNPDLVDNNGNFINKETLSIRKSCVRTCFPRSSNVTYINKIE